jgi:hypothetical protein
MGGFRLFAESHLGFLCDRARKIPRFFYFSFGTFPDLCPKILLRIFTLAAYLPQAFAISSVGGRRLSCRRPKKKSGRTPEVASARTA